VIFKKFMKTGIDYKVPVFFYILFFVSDAKNKQITY